MTHRRTRAQGDAGMTLLEVVVAFVVLMIVLVPISEMIGTVLGQAGTARIRLTALSLAEQWIEKLDNQGPPTKTGQHGVPDLTATITEKTGDVLSGVTYGVSAKFAWTTAVNGGTLDLCLTSTGPKVLDLQVTVSWTGGEIKDTTVIAYPAPDEVKQGFISVLIEGASGTPPADVNSHSFADRVAAIPVTISKTTTTNGGKFTYTLNPTYYTKTSDKETGCVFDPVVPGDYTVKVGQPSHSAGDFTENWVENANEAETPTDTTTVIAGLVSSFTFQYDEGSLVKVSYPTSTASDGGVRCPDKGHIDCVAFGQSPKASTSPGGTARADLYVLTSTSGAAWTETQPTVSTYDVTRLADVACASTTKCIAVGTVSESGTYHAVALSSPTTTPPAFTAAVITGSALTNIVCPEATICYATGWKSTGAAEILSAGTLSTTPKWTSDTVPKSTSGTVAAATITSLVCASKYCYASVLYKTSKAPELISTTAASTSKTTWKADTLPTGVTITAVYDLACASALASTKPVCYVGTTSTVATTTKGRTTKKLGGVELSVKTTKTTTWVQDTLSITPTTVTDITCLSATKCFEVGTYTSGKLGFVLSSAGSTAWTSSTISTASTIVSVTTVTCIKASSTTQCYAIGATSTMPVLLAYTKTHTKWVKVTLSGVTFSSLADISCITAHCLVIGTSTGSGAEGLLMTVSGTTLSKVTVSGTTTESFGAVSCATTSVCSAVGTSQTAARFLDGTASGTTWATKTPSGLTGLYPNDVPISLSNTELRTTDPLIYSTTDPSLIGPLFPFTSGYSIAAAACSEGVSGQSVSATSVPGATTPTHAAKVTLPMGLLPVQTVNKYGQNVSGATVTIAPATVTVDPDDPDCTAAPTRTGVTKVSSWALTKTDGLGLTAADVMYGVYKVTVTLSTYTVVKWVNVTPSVTEVFKTVKTTEPEVYTTLPVPTPVVVTIT